MDSLVFSAFTINKRISFFVSIIQLRDSYFLISLLLLYFIEFIFGGHLKGIAWLFEYAFIAFLSINKLDYLFRFFFLFLSLSLSFFARAQLENLC